MSDFTDKERDQIERFKIGYRIMCYKQDEIAELKNQIEVINTEMQNIRSTSRFDVPAGKVSSREVNNDARMAALIQKKQAMEKVNLPRIQDKERFIDMMDESRMVPMMPDWCKYLLKRVYHDGATFEEVSAEREDCHFTRMHLQRKLGKEILEVMNK
ncbi:MAG: hypothetical protein LKF48_07560 [Prevotella sp.]|nr:hypothetical protein [Prevotella sp.]MCH4182996.1 hypothetical protein [Prevotella sp.]